MGYDYNDMYAQLLYEKELLQLSRELKFIFESETSYNNALLESFLNTPKGIAAIKKAIIIGAISLSAFLSSPIVNKLDNDIKEEIIEDVMKSKEGQLTDKDGDVIDFEKIPHFAEKLEAVTKVIAMSAKAIGYKGDKLPVDPAMIVYYCWKYNYDIPMLLAQAHWESHFGADKNAKRAQKTKSMFSVGLYDNGKNVVSYDSFEDSIPSYINLLKKDYLVHNKSVNDLLKDGGFVNFDGKRYASNPRYEQELRNTRNKYLKMFPVLANNS